MLYWQDQKSRCLKSSDTLLLPFLQPGRICALAIKHTCTTLMLVLPLSYCCAVADPYFSGLSQPGREPSAQPVSKLSFEFERRKLTTDEVSVHDRGKHVRKHTQQAAEVLASQRHVKQALRIYADGPCSVHNTILSPTVGMI